MERLGYRPEPEELNISSTQEQAQTPGVESTVDHPEIKDQQVKTVSEQDLSWWEIISGADDYLKGVPGIAAAWKRGGHKGDQITRKLDKIFGFDKAWEHYHKAREAEKRGEKYIAPEE